MVRLLTLSIRNFRGIRSLDVDLKGKNASFIGPNGSGKSSVVDALDFLFTGGIRRLQGEGAGDLSLQKHGPHIDADPKDSTVEATFRVDDKGEPVRLRRCVGTPSQLEADFPIPRPLSDLLKSAQEGGHHLLTRRELLRFIFTEPSSRGKQVAAILQLTEVDAIRIEIQGAAREAVDAASRAALVEKISETSVLRSFAPEALDMKDVLLRANANRQALAGPPLADLDDPRKIRAGLTPPASAGSHPLQGQRARELLGQLAAWCTREGLSFTSSANEYRREVGELRADVATVKSLQAAELLRRGLALLSANECPLCLTTWDLEQLRTLLSTRLARSREAEGRFQKLSSRRVQLMARLESTRSISLSLGDALGGDASLPRSAINRAASLGGSAILAILPQPLEGELASSETVQVSAGMISGSDLAEEVRQLEDVASKLPDLTGVQKAWDELSTLEASLKEHHSARRQTAKFARAETVLTAADGLYVRARDEVLDSTYSAVGDRLKALYASIHRHDEKDFTAALQPTKAGLRLEVSFYDRGAYPPSALHSEGHQDSMGLCFFLALAEYLTQSPMPLIILDDVLMSIDHRHRRAVAELLRDQFSGSQMLITTHDRVWWRQLKSVGVVQGANSFEFTDWSLADGPHTSSGAVGLLGIARQALDANRVPQAAHAMRRAIEEQFPDVCHQLGAAVRFRADGAHEAGEFIGAALSQNRTLFNKARAAAHSWGDKTVDWGALDEERKAAFRVFEAENWAVNPSVHYNEWASDLTREDFQPVFAAYERLFKIFLCGTCGSCLRAIEEGNKKFTALRCNCGLINWNLQSRDG